MRRRWIMAGMLVGTLGGALALALLPARTAGLESRAQPASSYAEAIERVAALEADAGPTVNRVCRTIVLTHGHAAARAFVLFHGFTSCPQQFRALGERLHALGHNVLVPRMPYHGLADLMSRDQARLTAAELARFVDASVDIAQGLGQRVTVAGLSAGGIMAAWAGQQRADIERAVVMSPALGIHSLSARLNMSLMHVLLRSPNRFRWWDPQARERIAGPAYVYPQLSSRALGEIMRLGAAVRQAAGAGPPAARDLLVISNAADIAVNSDLIAGLVASWRLAGRADARTYVFDSDLALPHDFIDPDQVGQQVDRVYPLLLEMLVG